MIACLGDSGSGGVLLVFGGLLGGVWVKRFGMLLDSEIC